MIQLFQNKKGFLDELEFHREKGTFQKSGKAMRKVASLPIEVDLFFERMFGPDYYKDPDMFTKHFTEWRVNKPLKF